jgi:ATP-binding cassette subfamily D (ALD) protein 4
MPPAFCYVYFVVGTLISRLIARSLPALVYELELREGNFRFRHAQNRLFANSISLLNGHAAECCYLDANFCEVYRAQEKLIIQSYYLSIFTTLFSYAGSIMNYVIVGGAIFIIYSRAGGSEEAKASLDTQTMLVTGRL